MSKVYDLQHGDTKLTSDVFDDFKEALEVLYILANISGRIKFTTAWPHAASVILGEDLLRYDRDGTDDRARRAVLESEAEERRLAFLAVLDALEDKSVIAGSLQVEYVKPLIERWGRGLALYVYSLNIVDRFIVPPPIEAVAIDQGFMPEGDSKNRVSASRNDFSLKVPNDPMDNVRPIAVKPPPSIGVSQDIAEAVSEEAVSITFMSSKTPSSVDEFDTETKPEATEE